MLFRGLGAAELLDGYDFTFPFLNLQCLHINMEIVLRRSKNVVWIPKSKIFIFVVSGICEMINFTHYTTLRDYSIKTDYFIRQHVSVSVILSFIYQTAESVLSPWKYYHIHS